jgi:hypothetical protein
LCEDVFLVALQTKPSFDFDLYADGRLIAPKGFEAGSVAIFGLWRRLYGGDFFGAERSEWDPESLHEKAYDIKKAQRMFER